LKKRKVRILLNAPPFKALWLPGCLRVPYPQASTEAPFSEGLLLWKGLVLKREQGQVEEKRGKLMITI